MASARLSELRIDENTWNAGSTVRRQEWRLCIQELLSEGNFELAGSLDSNGPDGALKGRITLASTELRVDFENEQGQPVASHALEVAELEPLIDAYMQTCLEMTKLGLGLSSPRLEALDIAKRITHDEAGELIVSRFTILRVDHATARRLFTLVVTLFHDTSRLAAPPHTIHY